MLQWSIFFGRLGCVGGRGMDGGFTSKKEAVWWEERWVASEAREGIFLNFFSERGCLGNDTDHHYCTCWKKWIAEKAQGILTVVSDQVVSATFLCTHLKTFNLHIHWIWIGKYIYPLHVSQVYLYIFRLSELIKLKLSSSFSQICFATANISHVSC